jgi:hypothetical protein
MAKRRSPVSGWARRRLCPADGDSGCDERRCYVRLCSGARHELEADFPGDDPALFSRILEAVHDDISDPFLPVASGIPAADYSAMIVPSVWRSARTKVDTPAISRNGGNRNPRLPAQGR